MPLKILQNKTNHNVCYGSNLSQLITFRNGIMQTKRCFVYMKRCSCMQNIGYNRRMRAHNTPYTKAPEIGVFCCAITFDIYYLANGKIQPRGYLCPFCACLSQLSHRHSPFTKLWYCLPMQRGQKRQGSQTD